MMRFGGGVFWFARAAALAAVGLTASAAMAQRAPQLPPKEDARIALIDYCVREEAGRHSQFDDFVSTCKCATNKLISEMSEEEMQGVAKWRKPTTPLKKRWEAAYQACSN